MAKKRTPKKSFDLPKTWQAIGDFFVALGEIIIAIGKALLVVLEKILRVIVDLILAVAKVIQAVGVAVLAIVASVFLVVVAGYLFAKAIDLPGSQNFQKFREETFAILLEAAEPDFASWRSASSAWIDYRSDLKKLHDSNLSHEDKVQKLGELKSELSQKLDEEDPSSLEGLILKGE